jgi:hypothetical protein
MQYVITACRVYAHNGLFWSLKHRVILRKSDLEPRATGLSIWRQLYAMVWLAFLQIVFAVASIPGFRTYLIYGHVVLGLIILGLAHYNYLRIKRTEAPNRLKRIAKSTAVFATIQPIFGITLFVNIVLALGIPYIWVIALLHLVIALAIITQASSVATAYDMWEEKEIH